MLDEWEWNILIHKHTSEVFLDLLLHLLHNSLRPPPLPHPFPTSFSSPTHRWKIAPRTVTVKQSSLELVYSCFLNVYNCLHLSIFILFIKSSRCLFKLCSFILHLVIIILPTVNSAKEIFNTHYTLPILACRLHRLPTAYRRSNANNTAHRHSHGISQSVFS